MTQTITKHSDAGQATAHADPLPHSLPQGEGSQAVLTEQITAALRTVHDPEIPVNIYDLGLIYRADLQPVAGGQYDLTIDMTLTAPNCPVADTIPTMVRQAVLGIPGLGEVTVNLVWDPPWDKSRMSDAARLQLDMF